LFNTAYTYKTLLKYLVKCRAKYLQLINTVNTHYEISQI